MPEASALMLMLSFDDGTLIGQFVYAGTVSLGINKE